MVKRVIGLMFTLVMVACMSGCASLYGGGPRAPLPVPPNQAAEVERMQARAKAIAEVAGALEQGATSDLVRGQAHQALTEASDAEIKLGNRPGDKWFARAKTSLHRAESYLSTAISQGGQLTPKLCADDEIQAALPEQCKTVQVAASQASAQADTQGDLIKRASAAGDLAKQALTLAGTDDSRSRASNYFMCNKPLDVCLDGAKDDPDRLAVFAGLAVYGSNAMAQLARTQPQYIVSHESDVQKVETLANQARDEAKTIISQRESIATATAACDANAADCKAKCDSGDGSSCVAWARAAWKAKTPKLPAALAAMQAGCTSGMRTACIEAPLINGDIQAAGAQVENAWSDVVQAGDDVALKNHVAATFAQIANTPYKQLELQRVRAVNAAVVTERYCPARRTFLGLATITEFHRRAASHCKDEPPVGQGLSGAQVTLTTECVQAFATHCP